MMELSEKPLKDFSNLGNRTRVERTAINYIRALNAKELPLGFAQERFSELTGLYDRTTLKAYFGAKAHKSVRKLQRVARYGTGTMSFKTIELSQSVITTQGYLEKMGLATFEHRGETWFMVVNKDALLVPQLRKSHVVSMPNISLSSISSSGVSLSVVGANVVGSNELEQTHNIQDEREKLYDNRNTLELNPLESAILRATPTEEPDKAKTNLGDR